MAFAWEKWENSQVRDLTFECRGRVYTKPDGENVIAAMTTCLADFDFKQRSYFICFCIAEFLSLFLCVANFLYYFFLFDLPRNGIAKIILDYPLPHFTRNANDTMMMLFPREIACIYKSWGSGNQEIITSVRCTVGYQDFNEVCNITAFLFSALVSALYVINIVYLAYTITTFSAYLKNPTPQDVKYISKLSMRMRLVLILLFNNMDGTTHETLMLSIINSQPADDSENNSPSVALTSVNGKNNQSVTPNNDSDINNPSVTPTIGRANNNHSVPQDPPLFDNIMA